MGIGLIFGFIFGVLYGFVVMFWIVFGCIFVGVVYDYFCGMLSICYGGVIMLYLVGKFLGKFVKLFINVLVFIFFLLVGVVFVVSLV